MTDSNRIPKTNKYKTYVLSKVYRIINQSPVKLEYLNKPFYRIIYNLINKYPAFNKYSWVLYIACSENNFYLIFIYKYKSKVTEVLRKAINII